MGAVVGCRSQKITEKPADDPSIPWNQMHGDWQRVSGGDVEETENLKIGWGESITTVRWEGQLPQSPFEMKLSAKRVDGTDFFCAVTFPARMETDFVTLVIGGWGGSVVGISSIDGKDASENETTTYQKFETAVWYEIHLENREGRIVVSIDGESVIDLDTTGKTLALREGPISDCVPFGLATWQTTGLVKDIRWRGL